jgi:aldose 1-epimerase
MKEDTPRPAMEAVSYKSGIRVTCLTDLPGIQIYTGNFLDSPTGKNGAMTPHTGFCMETQFFPNSPNRPDFPSAFLKAGDHFHSETIFRFERV